MITFSNVGKRFGAVQALAGVSLDIRAGERVALVGTNGSGKTTLMRALCGLLRVAGKIEISGVDVAAQPHVALAALAYVPQMAPPLDAPVKELVRAWCVLREKRAEQVELRAAKLGLDLRAVSRTRVRDLSGGMKQKLLAALALTADAPILVCDEPTANLDAAARAAFFQQVNARPAGSILVLCSHRVEEVRHLVDRVVELKEGRVLKDSSLQEVLHGLKAFRVDVSFRNGPLAAAELAALGARGFVATAPGHFQGRFTQEAKLEALGRLAAEYGERLLDLSVTDAESLDEAGLAPATSMVDP